MGNTDCMYSCTHTAQHIHTPCLSAQSVAHVCVHLLRTHRSTHTFNGDELVKKTYRVTGIQCTCGIVHTAHFAILKCTCTQNTRVCARVWLCTCMSYPCEIVCMHGLGWTGWIRYSQLVIWNLCSVRKNAGVRDEHLRVIHVIQRRLMSSTWASTMSLTRLHTTPSS